MAKVTLYIAISLDGYIAREDGAIDWLSVVEQTGEDYGYAAFYDTVDAVVLGRKTYEQVLGFDEWLNPRKPAFVVTHQSLTSDRDDVFFVSESADHVMQKIIDQGYQHIWLIGGGGLNGAFLQHDLIDEYIISVIPIILGKGIRLFESSTDEQLLTLQSSQSYPSGLVQMHYRVNRDVG